MDLINTLSGDGTGIAKNSTTQVAYELKIYQHRLTVGTDNNVPGLLEIQGWIHPVFGKDQEALTLEMNDSSTLKFKFTNGDGAIQAKGSITPLG
jgi:hypothetical protein